MKKDIKGKKIVLVISSEGYESKQYKTTKQELEKAGIVVVTTSDRMRTARGNDGTTALVDITLDNLNVDEYSGVFVLGGPGAIDCLNNKETFRIINDAKDMDLLYGSIGIATRILAPVRVFNLKKATGWNRDFKLRKILSAHGALYDRKDVVIDGRVVTARGSRVAKKFAQGIIKALINKVCDLCPPQEPCKKRTIK